MTTSDDALLERITVDPEKCGGRPCLGETRIRVVDVLNMLGGGMTEAEILGDYPQLTEQDVRAALVFAAQQFDHPVLSA
ncbi:MAG: hypothetical protein C0506_15035 [Anaerolinea sp.]|nr:hypothetical protein [Anaerolinea sp.]